MHLHYALKACVFLCGSVWGQTKDPVDPERASIRWQNDSPDPCQPTVDSGSACFYCDSAWKQHVAATTLHRSRELFCQQASRDSSVGAKMAEPRAKLVEKCRKKRDGSAPEKRRGFNRSLKYTG